MRKLFTAVILSFVLVSAAYSQTAFHKGDQIGQVGLGFGFEGMYGSADVPPITLGYQYGVDDKFSVGGILGYTSSSESYYDWKWKYSYVLLGARGEFHFLERARNWDAYVGLTLGYAIVSTSTPSDYHNGGYSEGNSYAVYGFHLGAKYFVSPKVAIFGELGYGIGYLTVGAAFRL